MSKSEVIIVYENRVVRVSSTQWGDVMSMAGQMEDDQQDYGKSIGHSMHRTRKALEAYKKLSSIAFAPLKGD